MISGLLDVTCCGRKGARVGRVDISLLLYKLLDYSARSIWAHGAEAVLAGDLVLRNGTD